MLVFGLNGICPSSQFSSLLSGCSLGLKLLDTLPGERVFKTSGKVKAGKKISLEIYNFYCMPQVTV